MEKKYISIYEKYSNYSKEAILLAINTLPINDRMILKKKFGPSYLGNGYTFKNDESNYQLAEKNLLKRIIEVSEMLKLGKNSQEIMNYYRNAYVKSIYNSYSNYTTNIQTIKLKESFIENFLPQYRNIVKEQLLDSLTTEEKEIICLFYWGKDYSFLRKDIDSTKYKEFNSLFFKLNDKARKIFQQKGVSIKNTTPRKKKIKTEEKVKEIKEEQGLLHYFEEKDYDKVLKIVESLKITNPNYYDVICKKYSGEKYEIRNNIKLSKEEQTVFNIALRKIRRFILNNEINTFLHHFDEKDHDKVLDIVESFKITNPNYYDVICKKYSGEKYEIRNNIKLSKQEQTIFKNALQKIKNVILGKTGNKVLKQTKKDSGFLHYFEEKDYEKVLDIVDSFKITNPNYYDAICKKYSGEKYEIRNNIKLSKQEQTIFKNALQKIKNVILGKTGNKVLKQTKKDSGFLHYFEEKDHEKVLKIVEGLKITNPNYYEVIYKNYSGKNYEIKNNDKISKSDYRLLKAGIIKIRKMLLDNVEIKTIKELKEEQGFLHYFEEKDHEKVLKIVESLKITNPNYYDIICKKYSGKRYEIKNNIKLSSREHVLFTDALYKIKKVILNKNENIVVKEGQGLLYYFEEKDYEKVLKIVESLKITNPNYYDIICKKYSGEKYEIRNNIKLSKKEHILFNNALDKIKKVILNKKEIKNIEEIKEEQGFLHYFEEKDHKKVLDIIESLKITNPNYYDIICKKYSGKSYEIKNNIKLSRQEHALFNNALQKIKNTISDKKENKVLKQTKKDNGLLHYFDAKDHEKVLDIIESFKITNPNYYEVIYINYSGKRYEIKNNDKISKSDYRLLMNGIIKIRKMLLDNVEVKTVKEIKEENGLLHYFEEKDHEKVLKIIEKFKITNSNYYEIICKKYSGEKYEIKNNIKLSRKDQNLFNSALIKIKNMLLNNMEIKYNIYQLKKQISNLEFTDDCIDYCIDNLNYFSKDHSIELINLIAKYYPHKIKKIVESDYLKEKFKLSLKKQEYIYLKLLSYTNKHLTKDVILKILNEENLEKNKIMDIEEQVDELDQKIKTLTQKNR